MSSQPPWAPEALHSAGMRPLVLVVDDFEDNRSMYAAYLAYSGYEVAEAADGQSAIEIAGRSAPDVIVMDLSLPVMDGWEATRRLKADVRTQWIPIIAVTGHAMARHSRDAQEAGCDAFLTKPCLPEVLVEKVQELLEKRRGGAPTIATSAARRADPPGQRPDASDSASSEEA
jgi:two-component system cell cycle response regulator DivK